jgi:shikimate dehydrogenase
MVIVKSASDKYAVFGHPIRHSKSPFIHKMFAQQTSQNIDYGIVEPGVDDFGGAIENFFKQGALGANVTAPFKLNAFKFAGELSVRAKEAGSVNTLKRLDDGGILGDTTDGPGLVGDLIRQFGSLQGLKVLLLGAGGAARGVIGSLFAAGVGDICVANRTLCKAQDLVSVFSLHGEIVAVELQGIPHTTTFDLIINSTSSSMTDSLPEVSSQIFHAARFTYDMAYKDTATRFQRWAMQHNSNVQTSDGLGMLVGQAAESFYIWRGVKPDIEPVIKALRATL